MAKNGNGPTTSKRPQARPQYLIGSKNPGRPQYLTGSKNPGRPQYLTGSTKPGRPQYLTGSKTTMRPVKPPSLKRAKPIQMRPVK